MCSQIKKHIIKAVITDKRGRTLSIGYNSWVKTHTMMAHYANKVGESPDKIFLHAEVDAILKCRDPDKAYKIFISRLSTTGKYMLAKPCRLCQEAIKNTKIKVVEHT